MDTGGRHRLRAVRRLGLRVVALAVGACLVTSCGAGASDRGSEPTSPGTRTTPGGLPTTPVTGNAGTLARQVERAAATLRDPAAPADDVRRAAEFQQLAVHTLAAAPAAYRRDVTGGLRPETARAVRSDVRAARSLAGLTSPAPELPRWRIVTPPPAPELLRYYRKAQRRTGVPWTYLAAVHLVETRMGRIRGTSTAGARGPMQFIPSTWDIYGAGGDIDDPHDAILAAGRLLADNGAPDDMAAALHAYNPSGRYVRAVSEHARTMQRSTSAYHGYWHWRVLYRHERGTYVLPVGYPETDPVQLPER